MFGPPYSWMRSSFGASSAASIDITGSSTSYSTTIASHAAAAISSSVAATAAIGSPTYRAFSCSSARSSWVTGRMPNLIGRSAPVITARTPGTRRAAEVSMDTMRACGCGLRRILQCSVRAGSMSSA